MWRILCRGFPLARRFQITPSPYSLLSTPTDGDGSSPSHALSIIQQQQPNHALIGDSSEAVGSVCSLVCRSYEDGDRTLKSLPIDHLSLSPEHAVTVVAALAETEGSMIALSFFHWTISHSKFRLFMRLYITTALSLVRRRNPRKAHEVMRCMLGSFAEVGRVKEAIDMVFEMRNQGLPLCLHTLNRALRVAVDSGFIDLAERMFDELPDNGVLPDSYSFKTMLVAYCRARRVADVERLLLRESSSLIVDNVTCTAIVGLYCEKGYFGRVRSLFERMRESGVAPNLINYTAFINGLCRKGSVKRAFEVLEEMVTKGLRPNVYTHTVLIDGLCKIGWTERAFRLFLKLVRSESYKPNVRTYTAMICGYCSEGKINRAEMLLTRMREQGIAPNTNTFTTLIDGHCKSGNLDRAFELMKEMTGEGLLPNIWTYNAVMDGLCKKGRVHEAYKLLESGVARGLKADLVTYTILMSEHCKRDDMKRAMDLFDKMAESTDSQPDIHTYTTLIAALCKKRRTADGERLFERALSIGLVPTKQTFTALISGHCRDGNASSALKVFERMTSEHGCAPDSVTYGALISGLCKELRLEEAKTLYHAMVDKGLVPCEVSRVTLAYEYCVKEEPEVAMALLDRLEKKAWIRTANVLTRKLSCRGDADTAALFLRRLLEKDRNMDRITFTAFVNACYGCGKYSLASELLDRTTEGMSTEMVVA
ncbi:Pentatricopeptide repeat-containing protein [Acorus calamus]|uniref:Pentatricopeptide repeat-containing protein n=1 Tax=Acorus calamus TaxID=4465 RepID=A0AAV9FCW9_ACOCL|nr:Pentatricopeptide repeat-containing protein [Acorus calamus]